MFKGINLQQSHQQEPAFGREKEQVKNLAEGYVFQVDKWMRLNRFLVLGSEGGTYYASEKKLTLDNVHSVLECLREDGTKTVQTIRDVSHSGRAAKNDYAIFALALAFAFGDEGTKRLARIAFNDIVRIGTHLYQFASYLKQIGVGWGQAKKKAIADWINSKDNDTLAYQFLKYQNRVGWRNMDIIRISHPIPTDEKRSDLYSYFVGRGYQKDTLPALVEGYEKIKSTTNPKEACKLIERYNLPRECVPGGLLQHPEVWRAVLPNMPLTALLRNLGKLTQIGVLKPLSDEIGYVCERLTDGAYIKKSRVHPYAVLNALSIYNSGVGFRGKLRWKPIGQISDALDEMFYKSFENVEPTNKRLLLALDVSGSMDWPMNNSTLTPRVASACMAMVTARAESKYAFVAFSHEMVPVNITKTMALKDVVRELSILPFGGTDCALPMLWARDRKILVDAFVVYTDNETWYGRIHPFQALQQYRRVSGIQDAKLIVVGMTVTDFTIADPDDPNMLDVIGMDTATPELISSFIRDEF